MKGRAAALVLLLAACGSHAPAPVPNAVPSPVPKSPIVSSQVIPAAFGDRDPVAWSGRRPDAYAVHGTDTSRWQPAVDWQTARGAGVNFAFIKATEGGDRRDPAFDANWAAAAAAGVPRGAYHFYYFCTDAATQARWFIANVPRESGMLPPVLDLEWNHRSPTCRTRPDAATVRASARLFLDIVGRHYGQRPIVYTTPEFWRDNDLGQLGPEDFWLRAVTEHPAEAYPGIRWTFWQYSGTGSVPGIAGRADLNVFAGSATDWSRWLAARRL
jgi:lysozyme